MLKIGLIVLTLGVAGCASPYQHWLTDEEDARLRKNCEPIPGHCVMVPTPLWMQIQQLISAMKGTAI